MSQAFFGEIRLLPYTYAPRDWAWCNGQTMYVQQNTALFAVIGNAFGGNGQTTYLLPNLQGVTPMHSGTGPGLTTRNFASTGGDTTVPLNLTQIPGHTHTLYGDDVVGTQGTPSATVYPSRDKANKRFEPNPVSSNMVTMGSNALAPAGGSQPHSNVQPSLVVNHCICIQGMFPSRN